MPDLLLFTQDSAYAKKAEESGMDSIIVDWEWRGKAHRQTGKNTEINYGSAETLINMRAAINGHLTCRINNAPRIMQKEAELAVELGANEIWLPMVRHVSEVEACIEAIGGRATLGLLVETREALTLGPALNNLPVSRVYIGLNDLSIELGTVTLFSTLTNQVVESFRASYEGPLGVAGFTHPDKGSPIPCRLLLAEMSRLSCQFAVGRRSLRADTENIDLKETLAAIKNCFCQLEQRSPDEIMTDRAALQQHILALEVSEKNRVGVA